MTRKDLEANLGRKMYLRLFDGEEITGILHKTNEERYNDRFKEMIMEANKGNNFRTFKNVAEAESWISNL